MLLNQLPQTWWVKQSINYLTVSGGQEYGLNFMISHKAMMKGSAMVSVSFESSAGKDPIPISCDC